MKNQSPVPLKHVERAVFLIRGHKVILDASLAELYKVETKALVRAVKRNIERFPPDFMLRISEAELSHLRYQIGTSSSWGGRRYQPYAFTEQGVAMLSSVLRSARAVQVNIEIMRAFVRPRQMVGANVELAKKLAVLEKRCDSQFRLVFDAIRELIEPPRKPVRRIGFRT